MEYQMYNIKGADILALENQDSIVFFMNYKRNDFIFCGAKKGKLSDLTEDEIFTVWESFFEMVFVKECVLIDNCENEMDELETEEIEKNE